MEGVRASVSDQDPVLSIHVEPVLPYQVPEGYFSTLPERIMQEIHSASEAEARIKSHDKDLPYQVPAGYFASLADKVMHQINTAPEDLDTDTSFIDSLGKTNPYQVPEGYFDGLAQSIAQQSKTVAGGAHTTEEASKPSMILLRFKRASRWASAVAAACVLLIFGLGANWMLQNNSQTTQLNSRQLAFNILNTVSDEDIEQYLENELDGFDLYSLMESSSAKVKGSAPLVDPNKLLDEISPEDIDAYLDFEGI